MNEQAVPLNVARPASRRSANSFWGWIVPLPPAGQPRKPLYLLRWIVLRIALFYGALCLMLAVFQRSLIYHPEPAASLPAAQAGLPAGAAHDVELASSAGTLHGWHVLPLGEMADSQAECDALLAKAERIVLYFPGNAGHRGFRTDEMHLLSECGAHTFLFDYRGYAENPGSPSEDALVGDAHLAWNYLTIERGVPGEKIVLLGESLGGGVATRLASDLCRAGTPPGGLILRSTFTSLGDAAAYHFPWIPVKWLLVDTFRSDKAMPDVSCPILCFHGARDGIVPFSLGSRLFDLARDQSIRGVQKRFVNLPRSDHNDVLATASGTVRTEIRAFFAALKADPSGFE